MQTPQPQIEPADAGDIAAMLELLRHLFDLEADFEFDARKQRCGLELLLASPSACVWVARACGRVVGMVSAQLVISTAEGARSAWLEDLCVAESARGRGVGTALLEAALTWARSRGATRAQLLADRTNTPALAFYQRAGWQPTQLGAWRKHLR